MNVSYLDNIRKAALLAEKLLSAARENEPRITAQLEAATQSLNVRLIGLENKFKSKKSLVRKLSGKAIYTGIPVERVAKRINDALRYTYLFAESEYAAGSAFIQNYLDAEGFQITKSFDAWKLAGTQNDTGYRGINLTVISSQKQKFELQLHTEASFSLKTDSHDLYEEFRNPTTTEKRRIEVLKKMLKSAERITRPEGV